MKQIDSRTVQYTPNELRMKEVFEDAQSQGFSVAMSIQQMRDYGYAQGWVVDSRFVTWLRGRNNA